MCDKVELDLFSNIPPWAKYFECTTICPQQTKNALDNLAIRNILWNGG